MILDSRLEFCDATALNTGAAGSSYLIGNVIDLGAAHRDIGRGEPMYLVIQVDTAVTQASTDGSVTLALCSDAQAAIAVDGTQTIHLSTGALTEAGGRLGTAGNQFAFAIPMEGNVYERYLGIVQTSTTQAVTAGKINAFLTLDVAKWQPYADAL